MICFGSGDLKPMLMSLLMSMEESEAWVAMEVELEMVELEVE